MTNQITYFERQLLNLERSIVVAAESVVPVSLGETPKTLLRRMTERIKELESQVASLGGDHKPRIMFSPTIHDVIDRAVERYQVPPLEEGVNGFALFAEEVVQYEDGTCIAAFPFELVGVSKSVLTGEEWDYLIKKIHSKITGVYALAGFK